MTGAAKRAALSTAKRRALLAVRDAAAGADGITAADLAAVLYPDTAPAHRNRSATRTLREFHQMNLVIGDIDGSRVLYRITDMGRAELAVPVKERACLR